MYICICNIHIYIYIYTHTRTYTISLHGRAHGDGNPDALDAEPRAEPRVNIIQCNIIIVYSTILYCNII